MVTSSESKTEIHGDKHRQVKALQMADVGSSLAQTKPPVPQRGKKVGFYKNLLQAFDDIEGDTQKVNI